MNRGIKRLEALHHEESPFGDEILNHAGVIDDAGRAGSAQQLHCLTVRQRGGIGAGRRFEDDAGDIDRCCTEIPVISEVPKVAVSVVAFGTVLGIQFCAFPVVVSRCLRPGRATSAGERLSEAEDCGSEKSCCSFGHSNNRSWVDDYSEMVSEIQGTTLRL
jgi:hypothetical protein